MEGPPISMFSTAISKVWEGFATVSLNGYRLDISTSILGMLNSSIVALWEGLSLAPSKPPNTMGCRVFKRPSIHSGNFVISSTFVTLSPAEAKSLAVPPVDIIS
jgi:hypothetical protein